MIKNIDRWITSYMKQELSRVFSKRQILRPIHIMFSCVDHYEPDWNGADPSLQMDRVHKWIEEYPKLADKHQDADGM